MDSTTQHVNAWHGTARIFCSQVHHILEMNGDSYRLKGSRRRQSRSEIASANN